MAWPQSQDYNEAIQNPRTSFHDPELRDGQAVVNSLGLPQPCSGTFADVYEMSNRATGGRWAVKCFTRAVPDLRERYAAIGSHLRRARLPFAVAFNYLDPGIRVRGQWYPVLKMQWVAGQLLNAFVREAVNQPAQLEGLTRIWLRLAQRLRAAGLAHGDLQHGNVLLVPGSTTTSLAVKLIDYDGLYVPALAAGTSGEVGHAAYQHPQRGLQGTYNSEVDRFPLLVIATALRCLLVGGKKLWDRYDNGDNLLFRATDLTAPAQSALIKELWQLDDAAAHALVGHLVLASQRPLEATPLLDELMADGRESTLTAADQIEVALLLRLRGRQSG